MIYYVFNILRSLFVSMKRCLCMKYNMQPFFLKYFTASAIKLFKSKWRSQLSEFIEKSVTIPVPKSLSLYRHNHRHFIVLPTLMPCAYTHFVQDYAQISTCCIRILHFSNLFGVTEIRILTPVVPLLLLKCEQTNTMFPCDRTTLIRDNWTPCQNQELRMTYKSSNKENSGRADENLRPTNLLHIQHGGTWVFNILLQKKEQEENRRPFQRS